MFLSPSAMVVAYQKDFYFWILGLDNINKNQYSLSMVKKRIFKGTHLISELDVDMNTIVLAKEKKWHGKKILMSELLCCGRNMI
jgi:hypothetical protein